MTLSAEKNRQFYKFVQIFSVAQFILTVIVTIIYKSLDQKLLIFISIVVGIMLSSAARRWFRAYLIDESTKSVEDFVKDKLKESK